MDDILVFNRKEKKYLLDSQKMNEFLERIGPYIKANAYGESEVISVYYDNDSFDLISTSVEKPRYKEKFRVRSYGVAGEDTKVFAEIKKKYNGTVYKRRVSAPYREIKNLLETGAMIPDLSPQIQKEILWMVERYDLKPKIWIEAARTSYEAKEDSNLRITFDSGLSYQTESPTLSYEGPGDPIIDPDLHIMEIKYTKGLPRWLVDTLSEMKIYPRGFSKVGTAFTDKIFDNLLQ